MAMRWVRRSFPALLLAAMVFIPIWAVVEDRVGRGSRAAAAVELKLVLAGLESPVHLESPRDGSGRIAVVDRAGVVYIVGPDGRVRDEPFLDLRDEMVRLSANYDERGLLGLAFHPRFQDNGKVYVYYSAPLRPGGPRGWNHTSRVSEFTVSPSDPNRVDLLSERIVMEIDQPQANHNGGALAFGPDGYLYIGLGDGGGGNDVGTGHPPRGNGQDVGTLLGSVLRIDVDRTEPGSGLGYGIPPTNPFARGGGLPEIFAWGFRNPYRLSFDRGGAGRLLVADVGQNLWEEVNLVTGPGNFGWRVKEGTFWFDAAAPNAVILDGPAAGAAGEPFLDPVIQYGHPGLQREQIAAALNGWPGGDGLETVPTFGISVIGGYVYRGDALPHWRGTYIFGDWSTNFATGKGKILSAAPTDPKMLEDEEYELPPGPPESLWPVQLVMEVPAFILGFGEDAAGELYVLTTERTGPFGGTGKVYKIVPGAD